MGRHTTALASVRVRDLWLLRFTWSPYEQMRGRKLDVQSRVQLTNAVHELRPES